MLVKNVYLPLKPFYGLGDFIRGCLSVKNICEEFGFSFEVDYSKHPISQFFENRHFTPIEVNPSEINIFDIGDGQYIENVFKQLSVMPEENKKNSSLFLTTNLWYLGGGVSEDTRVFMRESFVPSSDLRGAVLKAQEELGIEYGKYDILHVRMGDKFLVDGHTDETAFQRIHELILKGFQDHKVTCSQPLLVLSDCYALKKYLHSKEGWLYSNVEPCHLSSDVKDDRVRDTLIDMCLLSEAASVFCISNHGYGSGFCDWTCDIYNVPCIRFENPDVKDWNVSPLESLRNVDISSLIIKKHFDRTLLDQYVMDNNTLLVTLTNEGYVNFTLNLIESLKLHHLDKKIVCFCLDKSSYSTLMSKGYACLLYDVDLQSLSLFNTVNFKKITFLKFFLIHYLLTLRYNVLFTDGDIIFKRNPIPYILDIVSTGMFDIIIQNDDPFIAAENIGQNLCTGFFFVQSNERTLDVFSFAKSEARDAFNLCANDQDYFNNFMKSKLRVNVLSQALFPSGYALANIKDDEAYIVHFNYMVGNNKFLSMLENGYWYLSYDKSFSSNSIYIMTLNNWIKFNVDLNNLITYDCESASEWSNKPSGIKNISSVALKNEAKTQLLGYFKIDSIHNPYHTMYSKTNAESLKTINMDKYKENTVTEDKLSRCKFLIIDGDTHYDSYIIYTAIVTGCIPVIRRSKGISVKYDGCPIIWTSDFSDITESFLELKYEEMINMEFNFSCLFKDCYD